MAAFPAEMELKSTFPAPPSQYINQYSDDNVRRGRAPRPPLPPQGMQTEYTMFGVPFSADDPIIRPLESQVRDLSSCWCTYLHIQITSFHQ